MSEPPPFRTNTSGARRVGAKHWRVRLRAALNHPWLFQAALMAGLFAGAAYTIDIHAFVTAFRDARYEFLVAVLGVTVMARVLHAVEWQIELTKVGKAPLFGLMGVLLIGTLVNMVVPASAGDVAKVQIAANRYDLPRAGLIGTRGAEAVINAVIMVGFIALAFALPGGAFGSRRLLWAVLAASVALFVGAFVSSRILPEQLPDWRALRRTPFGLGNHVRYHWPRLYAGFEVIRRSGLLTLMVTMNLVGWGFDILIVWLYGRAFHLSVPIDAYIAVTVAIAIVTVFPITFGNIGTYELLVTSVLTLYGVDGTKAFAFAIATHVFSTAYNVVLGLVAVWAMHLRPGDVFRLAGGPRKKAPPGEPLADVS
jgi:uncharacterized membrane protein YbhN (UPF0104 family)